MSSEEKSMNGDIIIRFPTLFRCSVPCVGKTTYDCLSGNHCVVKVGHSKAFLTLSKQSGVKDNNVKLTLATYRTERAHSSSISYILVFRHV